MVRAMWVWIALAAALAWAVRRFAWGYRRPPAALRCLTAREYATLAAAANATFPPGGAIVPSGTEAGVPQHTDRFVAAQQPATRILMRLLFVLIEHATILFPGPGRHGRRRFSSLGTEQQVAVLDGWRRSRLFPRRLVFTSLRAILTMGYFADPAVLRQLGLAPRDIARRTCAADPLWPRIGETPTSVRSTIVDFSPSEPLPPLGVSGPLHPDFALPSPEGGDQRDRQVPA